MHTSHFRRFRLAQPITTAISTTTTPCTGDHHHTPAQLCRVEQGTMATNGGSSASSAPTASTSKAPVQSTSSGPSANTSVRTRYSKVKKVGEGTYASVFLAKNLETGESVAIKKIKINAGAGGGKDGLDPTALREVGFLREMKHQNVIALLDVFSSGLATQSLNLVLEFLDTNMEALIKDRSLIFTPADVKSWMAMMISGLEYCHAVGCLHRVSVSLLADRAYPAPPLLTPLSPLHRI